MGLFDFFKSFIDLTPEATNPSPPPKANNKRKTACHIEIKKKLLNTPELKKTFENIIKSYGLTLERCEDISNKDYLLEREISEQKYYNANANWTPETDNYCIFLERKIFICSEMIASVMAVTFDDNEVILYGRNGEIKKRYPPIQFF